MENNAILGSVEYSVVEPSVFQQLNGEGWILMDGRTIEGSKLSRLTGMAAVPDARGLFIRAMNENRSSVHGDADGNRGLGSYQEDHFKNHDHDVNYLNGEFFFAASGMGLQSNEGQESGRGFLQIKVAERGGSETRPRNISLFLYIKID